ncbi:MAG: cell division protein ZipA [Gammaproteobacteria bacterium]|nr:cell division protein ZipA [Gammaproteobacteria bacterium]
MTELRWILLVVGIIALVAIYFFGRQEQLRRRRRWEHEPEARADTDDVSFDTRAEWEEIMPEPERFDELRDVLREDDEWPRGAPPPGVPAQPPPLSKQPVESAPEQALSSVAGQSTEPQPSRSPATQRPFAIGDKIISLYVVARRPSVFRGDTVARAAENLNLGYGDMQIYNRMIERNGRRQIVFSLASAVQPGTFDADTRMSLTTPGVALFMQLPGPLDGLKAFNAMLDCAQQLAAELEGELLDESRCALSNQTIDHLREEIQLHGLRHARVRPTKRRI